MCMVPYLYKFARRTEITYTWHKITRDFFFVQKEWEENGRDDFFFFFRFRKEFKTHIINDKQYLFNPFHNEMQLHLEEPKGKLER